MNGNLVQVVAAGLRLVLNRKELQDCNPLVWGYRNVWFEFDGARLL